MPDDPTVWIIIAVVIALVFIVAIVKKGRRRLSVRGPGGIGADLQDTGREVTVGENLQAENAKVGNVVGSRSEAGSAASDVRVMNKATIKGGEFGDIIGEQITPAAEPLRPNDPQAGPPKKTE